MDTLEKLNLLGGDAQMDICGGPTGIPSAPPKQLQSIRQPPLGGIVNAYLPGGGVMKQLRVMLSNVCLKDCFYCVNRASRDFKRSAFRPEELARLYMNLYERGLVEGFFLTSGIYNSSDHTMNHMLQTVELLRKKYHYKGYIHLKIMPGASYNLVEAAAQMATRCSLNLEAPDPVHLGKLSPDKEFFKEMLSRVIWLHKFQKEGNLKSGIVTQFVVGAAGESDKNILKTINWLYKETKLRRIYFSAFGPVSHTPLQELPPENPMREHRLYQVDFLLRQYGFKADELYLNEENNLPLDTDPKLAWAQAHPEKFPIEINNAQFCDLLRVPGIGPVGATKIIEFRKRQKFQSDADLKRVGIILHRAAPYLLVNGKRIKPHFDLVPPVQTHLNLWASDKSKVDWIPTQNFLGKVCSAI